MQKGGYGITLDYSGMMADKIGEHGITHAELSEYINDCKACVDSMQSKRSEMKWRELPHSQELLAADINDYAQCVREKYEYFVVLGIGGSALGPLFVHTALSHMRYNELPDSVRKAPKLYIEDNIDPERMDALLSVIDVRKTLFNVITKSGATSETMAQFLIVCNALTQSVGKAEMPAHIVVTTDENKGNLIGIARELGIKTYYVPDGVGGRFSELCPVGLLPAAICGIDINALLLGASELDNALPSSIYDNPAYMYAVLQTLAMKKGNNISVMMPYADSLRYFSDWYAQLWAESLGKRRAAADNVYENIGQTPVKALGVTDQHSQVQLYTDGPFDKVISFLGVREYRSTVMIPKAMPEIEAISFLHGHSLNELIAAEQLATQYAIAKSGHMSNVITIERVDAKNIGRLIYFFELATAFAGELLSINAFDQPGVEAGKLATFALLGKEGYDTERQAIAEFDKNEDRYIL